MNVSQPQAKLNLHHEIQRQEEEKARNKQKFERIMSSLNNDNSLNQIEGNIE